MQTLASCTARERGPRLPGAPRRSRCDFDGEYSERLISEDPEIKGHFTHYFGDLLSLKLRSKLRSAALIEDAIQETFVRVLTTLKKRRGLTTPESLGAYVNSVASNVLFELYCGAGKVTPQDQNRHEPGERYPGAETMFVAADERLRVREALADLPQKEKTCCVGCSSKVVTETKSAGS